MLINLTGVNILQHVCVKSSQYTVHFTYSRLYINYTLINLGAGKKAEYTSFYLGSGYCFEEITCVYGQEKECDM